MNSFAEHRRCFFSLVPAPQPGVPDIPSIKEAEVLSGLDATEVGTKASLNTLNQDVSINVAQNFDWLHASPEVSANVMSGLALSALAFIPVAFVVAKGVGRLRKEFAEAVKI